jgi:hypothetical protein
MGFVIIRVGFRRCDKFLQLPYLQRFFFKLSPVCHVPPRSRQFVSQCILTCICLCIFRSIRPPQDMAVPPNTSFPINNSRPSAMPRTRQ